FVACREGIRRYQWEPLGGLLVAATPRYEDSGRATQPVRRKVALKIVKSGLDSAQVIARFEAERQAAFGHLVESVASPFALLVAAITSRQPIHRRKDEQIPPHSQAEPNHMQAPEGGSGPAEKMCIKWASCGRY